MSADDTNAADKKLHQSTGIPEFHSDSNFEQFRTNIREFLRLDRESIDTWAPLQRHDYAADARRAILHNMEKDWHLFNVEDQTGALGTDSEMSTDECVPSELFLDNF
ncbi:hypothetical protein KJ359_012774 [Pestalotiopsis sp. 9143b]|nr:hypothetical protein KJ359_012774 [Pestalotiopsis sp. 9143b]